MRCLFFTNLCPGPLDLCARDGPNQPVAAQAGVHEVVSLGWAGVSQPQRCCGLQRLWMFYGYSYRFHLSGNTRQAHRVEAERSMQVLTCMCTIWYTGGDTDTPAPASGRKRGTGPGVREGRACRQNRRITAGSTALYGTVRTLIGLVIRYEINATAVLRCVNTAVVRSCLNTRQAPDSVASSMHACVRTESEWRGGGVAGEDSVGQPGTGTMTVPDVRTPP